MQSSPFTAHARRNTTSFREMKSDSIYLFGGSCLALAYAREVLTVRGIGGCRRVDGAEYLGYGLDVAHLLVDGRHALGDNGAQLCVENARIGDFEGDEVRGCDGGAAHFLF